MRQLSDNKYFENVERNLSNSLVSLEEQDGLRFSKIGSESLILGERSLGFVIE